MDIRQILGISLFITILGIYVYLNIVVKGWIWNLWTGQKGHAFKSGMAYSTLKTFIDDEMKKNNK